MHIIAITDIVRPHLIRGNYIMCEYKEVMREFLRVLNLSDMNERTGGIAIVIERARKLETLALQPQDCCLAAQHNTSQQGISP